jgi:hypothetical protein
MNTNLGRRPSGDATYYAPIVFTGSGLITS